MDKVGPVAVDSVDVEVAERAETQQLTKVFNFSESEHNGRISYNFRPRNKTGFQG